MSFSIKQSTEVTATTTTDQESSDEDETEYEKYVNGKKKPNDLFSTNYSSYLSDKKQKPTRPKTPTKHKIKKNSLRIVPTQNGQSDFF